MAVEGSELESGVVEMPPLWPTPRDHDLQFADFEGCLFGWDRKWFRVYKPGNVKTKSFAVPFYCGRLGPVLGLPSWGASGSSYGGR